MQIAPATAGLLAADERIFVDTLHLVSSGPKLTEPATEQEMALFTAALPLRIKGNTPYARKQIVSAIRRWLHRLKRSTFASARDLRDVTRATSGSVSGKEDQATKRAFEKLAYSRRVGAWLQWFKDMLLDQIYPGSPTARSLMALDLYAIFVELWAMPATNSASASALADPGDNPAASLASTQGHFNPKSLFGSLVASRLVQLLLQDYEVRRFLQL